MRDVELYRQILCLPEPWSVTDVKLDLEGNSVEVTVAHSEGVALALLNQRYVAAFNRRHHRTGTLWESRFSSCLVETDSYLLTLYRYIELNPVRAAIVDAPERYRWSSASGNLGITRDSCITPHPLYLALAADTAERAKVYGAWLRSGLANEDLAAIRSHIEQERALGSPRFQAMIAKTLNRSVAMRPRGRPRKVTDPFNK